VAKKPKIALPLAPLPDLMAWWKSQKVRGVVIGGIAASILGRTRVTRDIDAMIIAPEVSWPKLITSATSFGLASRVPDSMAFAKESRLFLFRHQASGVDVDVALGFLPFEEETLARAAPMQIAGVTVPLPTPEDLIIMKAVANRDQDWLDIDGLFVAHPRMDLHRIRLYVQAFADAMEDPEIFVNLEKRLRQHSPRKRRKKK